MSHVGCQPVRSSRLEREAHNGEISQLRPGDVRNKVLPIDTSSHEVSFGLSDCAFAQATNWRGVRAVEGARLESVCTETYRGFESLPHRHK